MSDVLPSTGELLKAFLRFHELLDGKRIESLTEINLTDFLFEVIDDLDIKFNGLLNCSIVNGSSTLKLPCTCTRNLKIEND